MDREHTDPFGVKLVLLGLQLALVGPGSAVAFGDEGSFNILTGIGLPCTLFGFAFA